MQSSIQPSNKLRSITCLSLNSHFESPNASNSQPPFHIPKHISQIQPLSRQLLKPPLLGSVRMDCQNSTEHIGMSADIFGAAVHDDICSPVERILKRRWAKCCVDC